MSDANADVFRPAPYEYEPIDQAENITGKRRLTAILQALTSAPLRELEDIVRDGYSADAEVNVSHPINTLRDHEALLAQFWLPLRRAIPDAERREDIIAGGHYRGAHWIGCLGHYFGAFEGSWLGIPPSHRLVAVRFAEGHELRDGQIARSYVLIDFLDLMRQVGYWPIAPSLGSEMHWLPPMTHDGVILSPQDNNISRRSIERVLRMHAALGKYNRQPPTREVLDQMELVKHWHPRFIWYGPAGIGVSRGLRGFEEDHQIPFLVAFPDRTGSAVGHFIRIGDGNYAVTGGWGYLQATHTGNGFLGMPATGKRVVMRVMDFYRCDEETIVENWVPFDILHLLLQLGVDVFGRMRRQWAQDLPTSRWLVTSQ